MADMKSWSGLRLNIEGFWSPAKGDKIQGILLQRNRNPGGRYNAPYYVLQLTKPCAQVKLKNEVSNKDKGSNVAVPENINLNGLDELLGFEVLITMKDVREFTTDDGEVREVKEYDVKHSEAPVNQAAFERRRTVSA